MYDEFERALTGRSARRGLSPLGWIGVSLAAVLLLGVVGVGYAVTRVASRARHVVENLGDAQDVAVARVRSRLEESASLVRMEPDAGLAFLRDLGSGDPSQAILRKVMGGGLDLSDVAAAPSSRQRDGDANSMTIHSDDGDVRIGFSRGRDGGSLTVDSKDGHVRFNLARSATGGSLTIDSDDGHARIDLIRDDDGGRLVVRSDDGSVELAVGSNSGDAPRWVPRPEGMPDAPRPVFSVRGDESLLGAVTWEDDAAPDELLGTYRDTLERQGYQVQAEHRRRGGGQDEASLWARDDADGRTVFLLVRRTDGRTRTVLGYGEGDAAR
jgi:hypothetical protein